MNISLSMIRLPFLKYGAKPASQDKSVVPGSNIGSRLAELATRPLPLIGHLPIGRQLQILLMLLAALLALAAITAYVYNRGTSHSGVYISTATEMQMLSQRIANSAQQAAQGAPVAFDQLEQSRAEFNADLNLLANGGEKLGLSVGPSSSDMQPLISQLEKQWKPLETNIKLILAQRKNLIDLKKLETTIERAAPQLSLQALELVAAATDAQEPSRVVTYSRQLHVDVANFDFINAVRLLSTENPNPQVALQLAANTRQYQQTLNALLGNAKDASVSPISSESARRKAEQLNKIFTPFANGVQSIVANMEALAKAKQSSRDIFADSEQLLKTPQQLAQRYQQQSAGYVGYLIIAVLLSLLALACLVLLGRMLLEDARRRALLSEAENRRNQDAILRLLDEMGQLADGDLTVQARVTEDITGAIADSVNYTIEELRRLVSGITRAAAQVSAATLDAQRITGQLLEAQQNQANEIDSTGRSIVAMAKSISEVSDNAKRSADVAQQSLAVAEQGADAVQKAVRGMNDIREQIQETSKRIKRLGESSQEIGEIVQLITDITEQTNVLALNAAIQAASAGEAGRGFTVVAEEVQRLAERSAEATKHISAIVRTIQRDTQDTVIAMEHSTQGVVEGTHIADEAGQALHEIEEVSKRLAALIASISSATREQAESASHVEQNMKSILGITQLTTEGTGKTAASTAQLNALANELKSSVARFKVS
jgi:twitching motility protein PilJ